MNVGASMGEWSEKMSVPPNQSTMAIIAGAARGYFSEEECSKLSVVAPNIVRNIIRDYEVIEKKKIDMPDEVRGIVKCGNPKCITNHEPMQTVFDVVDKENGTLRCRYCNKDIHKGEIKLL